MELDIHQVFIDWVKSRRGSKLKAPDDKLFTGEFWSGVRGLELGLVDGLGDLHETLRSRFGDDIGLKVIEPKRGLFHPAALRPLRRSARRRVAPSKTAPSGRGSGLMTASSSASSSIAVIGFAI